MSWLCGDYFKWQFNAFLGENVRSTQFFLQLFIFFNDKLSSFEINNASSLAEVWVWYMMVYLLRTVCCTLRLILLSAVICRPASGFLLQLHRICTVCASFLFPVLYTCCSVSLCFIHDFRNEYFLNEYVKALGIYNTKTRRMRRVRANLVTGLFQTCSSTQNVLFNCTDAPPFQVNVIGSAQLWWIKQVEIIFTFRIKLSLW